MVRFLALTAAVISSIAFAGETNRRVGDELVAYGTEHSLDVLKTSCLDSPYYRISDYSECKVMDFGSFGSVDDQTYYYAKYCLVGRSSNVTCADAAAQNLDDTRRGEVVFVEEHHSGRARVLRYLAVGPDDDISDVPETFTGYFPGKPKILSTAIGQLLFIPVASDASTKCSDYTQSEYFVWQNRRWRPLERWQWCSDLLKRLPKNSQIDSNGPNISDLEPLQLAIPLQTPEATTVKVKLKIDGKRLGLDSYEIEPQPAIQ